MPTTYHRLRCLMVGTLPPSLVELRRTSRFAYPTNSRRHCERSEAIHVSASCAMDCFAALAMTTWRQWVCQKITCRANHLKPVQSFSQKYSAFVLTQITGITPRVSRQMRGVGHRHERAVRCDGRRRRARRTRLTRTAKSCGPDAAVLALSPREAKLPRATVARKPFTGESTK